MKRNPFKFGSVVDGKHFTNRRIEIEQLGNVLNSENHITIISPRRYGKTSLVLNVINNSPRPFIMLDIQMITSEKDLATQLLKRLYGIYPFEKVKRYIKNFRFIPIVSINPLTNAVDVVFSAESKPDPVLEDVLNLLEQLSGSQKKMIVIFDEFQDIINIQKNILNKLRAIMQHHKKINYVFLGSRESMIRQIFESKKSPFYHFGLTMHLEKIPEKDFHAYLRDRLKGVYPEPAALSHEIMEVSKCHPYYTQQLAYACFEEIRKQQNNKDICKMALNDLVRMHDIDYERIWASFNNTDKKLLIGLSLSNLSPLSEAFYMKHNIGATSTVYSSMKRLMDAGYIVKENNKYFIEDPFFSLWLKNKRNA